MFEFLWHPLVTHIYTFILGMIFCFYLIIRDIKKKSQQIALYSEVKKP